jgi:hypothetical protein
MVMPSLRAVVFVNLLTILLKLRTLAATSVRIGLAEIVFTHIPSSPKSIARYLTEASRLAFAIPIILYLDTASYIA